MKLIIKEYLASLKERDELDAILPDLLSQLGLNVYSRPARGTRQDGVDVGAVGSLDGGPEKVYLFSIKAGDLTRREWDGDAAQSLRPSLNEILDSYIPSRLPAEHRGKDISICITIGGNVLEQVRPLLTGYIAQNSSAKISFEEWNGDKLAAYIQSEFLREDLLPEEARSLLRKSLAMLDEPEISYRHFAALIRGLSAVEALNDVRRITAIRQMSICLWILFSWAREAENVESAYLAGEFTLLHAWNIFRFYVGQNTKAARAIETAFLSIFLAYRQVCSEFLGKNVLPYVGKLHAISDAIRGSCSLEVNLKLFDILGRLGSDGLWTCWLAGRCVEEQSELREALLRETRMRAEAVKELIFNNPALLLPAKDDQVVDILIATLLIAVDRDNSPFISSWLGEMVARAGYSYKTNGKYPCVLASYSELLEHPKSADNDYRKSATSASILYPSIALWAALIGDTETYDKVSAMKRENFQHCTFQFWYPDDASEMYFYTDSNPHGASLANVAIDRPKDEFLDQAFGECERSPHFKELSAVKTAWWPLIVIACRHYRLPLPLHFLEGIYKDLK
ncbi:hypothetical protein [Rhodocyclus tenuis]|uniref:hypothetical protein n=1 Tax=Rhodocyclus tenuis TaxID=1066 RepID=UPI00190450FE|nr:hypothetical protein [Rhodocyclus tenuis]MBK1681898.1 hypothetical protein [Rhodocyclus tenuis]